MTYAQYGLIEAVDYNSLAGPNPTTSSTQMNSVWSTGYGNAGYGQTALGTVAVGDTVYASNWASLVNATNKSALHQGTSITSVTAPIVGDTITALTAIPTNIPILHASRLNAQTQGSTSATTLTTGSTWTQVATFQHNITFASGDAARYFFNAGGQLKITCSHPNTTAGINLKIHNLAIAVGTIALSSPTSGTATIASYPYNGVTKLGGTGTPTINTNAGYYAWNTANTTVFTQTISSYYYYYSGGTNIKVIVKTNGTQGANGDAGSSITVYTVWDEVPNGLVVAAGSSTTLTLVPPETTNITSSWGTPVISGSVTQV